MLDTHTSHTTADGYFALVQYQYDRLSTLLDDRDFYQTAIHLLGVIHAALQANDLPPDLTAAYRQLERRTRTQMMQRVVLPNKPLF